MNFDSNKYRHETNVFLLLHFGISDIRTWIDHRSCNYSRIYAVSVWKFRKIQYLRLLLRQDTRARLRLFATEVLAQWQGLSCSSVMTGNERLLIWVRPKGFQTSTSLLWPHCADHGVTGVQQSMAKNRWCMCWNPRPAALCRSLVLYIIRATNNEKAARRRFATDGSKPTG